MDKHFITSTWDRDSLSAFEHDIEGHMVRTDGTPPFGDKSGASPKRLMLAALAGCTGVDVASVLKKMRVEYDKYIMEVEADLSKDEPKVYTEIRVTYKFWGNNLNPNKIEKAIDLSMNKYCGVTKMLRAHCPVTHELVINPE